MPAYKSGTEEKLLNEEAISCTSVGVSCEKLSMAPGPADVSSTCSETHEENNTEEAVGAVQAKLTPKDVEVLTASNPVNNPEFEHSSDGTVQQDQIKSNTEILSKEISIESSSQAMDITDSSKKIDQKNDDKDLYREAIEVSDSDSDDSESSSVSSLSSPSKSDSESDSDIECLSVAAKTKKGTYPVIKAKGELLPEDLPPIEELHISVPSSLCAEIGVVTSIVKTLVVIQSFKGVPALDLDSVLFLDSGSRALGLVFDVFGPVTEPLYCVRFNSEEQIAEYRVNPGGKVYYAPKTEHSKYVFLQQLLRIKGSDASNQWDVERQVQIEYSDDDEEQKAIAQFGDEILAEEEGLDLDQLKRKRDPNEVVEKKKKFAQFPPRNQRGGTGRGHFSPRTRPQQRPGPQHRQAQGQQYNPPPPYQGPIHPPLFNVPPPPIPVSSVQRQNPPPPPPGNNSQGVFPNPFYQNPVQQQSACFGQLPFAQPQMDPRIAQFGAQFAQMVCNLQSSTPGGSVGALPPVAPSFTTPYTQSLYTDSQSSYNAFFKPPSQGPQGTYSAPPFSTPPPLPQSNLSSMNVPPPGHPSFPPQPNQNATFGTQFSSSYSNYPNLR